MMTPEITRVKITHIPDDTARGFLCEAAAYIGDFLVITDMRLIREPDATYSLRMPSQYNPSKGRRYEVYHPINRDFYTALRDSIVAAYESTKGARP